MISENRECIIKARRFAREAHKPISITTVSGDIRPHVEHLQEVADLVWATGGSDIEIAAAWLHDSVEDTSTTIDDIKTQFGEEIAALVYGLTDLDEYKGLASPERKQKQADRVKNENESVRKIKLADQISNMRFITTDPKSTWLPEDNRKYIIGIKQVADECKKINHQLDELFDTEYAKTVAYFKI